MRHPLFNVSVTFIQNHSVYVVYIKENGSCVGIVSIGTIVRAGICGLVQDSRQAILFSSKDSTNSGSYTTFYSVDIRFFTLG